MICNKFFFSDFYTLYDKVVEEPGLLKKQDFEKWGVKEWTSACDGRSTFRKFKIFP